MKRIRIRIEIEDVKVLAKKSKITKHTGTIRLDSPTAMQMKDALACFKVVASSAAQPNTKLRRLKATIRKVSK